MYLEYTHVRYLQFHLTFGSRRHRMSHHNNNVAAAVENFIHVSSSWGGTLLEYIIEEEVAYVSHHNYPRSNTSRMHRQGDNEDSRARGGYA